MSAVRELYEKMSLRRSLRYAGISRHMWYHKPKARDIGLDPATVQAVQRIGGKRPTYGTRRMATQVCRETHTATNRKKIQRIFRKLGWIEPQKTKNDIIRTNRKLFKPDAPNQLWETDMTYVWCGMDGWCYCFNVVDCFTRRWISYAFDVDATKQVTIDSITNAASVENPDCSRLRLRTDNGTQYTSNDFRKAVSVFGIKHEFIWKHTPEQNGHVESFHKTLKKEYLWRHEFVSYQEAERILTDVFTDYNQERIHSAIGYMTPVEFASQWGMKNK